MFSPKYFGIFSIVVHAFLNQWAVLKTQKVVPFLGNPRASTDRANCNHCSYLLMQKKCRKIPIVDANDQLYHAISQLYIPYYTTIWPPFYHHLTTILPPFWSMKSDRTPHCWWRPLAAGCCAGRDLGTVAVMTKAWSCRTLFNVSAGTNMDMCIYIYM